MKTSVTGFPRVGKLRELKFATEKYFRKEISADELRETAKNIRISQWLLQQKNNIDYIPSNDFSFYDGTLDTAVLFNIIPKKYADTELSASVPHAYDNLTSLHGHPTLPGHYCHLTDHILHVHKPSVLRYRS